jgi:tetratricopeptide (TPR) repeat protein
MSARRSSGDELRKKAEQKHRRKGIAEAAPLYRQSALALLADGREHDAAEMLQAALADDGQHHDGSSQQQRDLRKLAAETLAAIHNMPAAISEYEEYVKSGTPEASTLRALAELYVTAGKTNIAIERLRRAVERGIGEGDIVEAATAAGRVADLMPESTDAAVQHVVLLRNVADERLEKALDHLAALYRAQEKLSQEVAVGEELLGIAPSRDDVRRRLASLYTRILEMDPHDDAAWQGLRKVDGELSEQLAVLLMDELADKQTRTKAS